MSDSVLSIAADVGAGRRSAVEIARQSLKALEAEEGRDRSFLEVSGELAMEEARQVDARSAAAERLPLAGVTMAIKDNLWV